MPLTIFDRSDNFLCFPLRWFACRPWLRLKTSWGWQPRVTTMVIVLPTFLVMVLMLRQMSFSFLPSSLQCHTLSDAINSVDWFYPTDCKDVYRGAALWKLLCIWVFVPQINTKEKTLLEKIDSHTLLLKYCVMSSYFKSTISDCSVASILYSLWFVHCLHTSNNGVHKHTFGLMKKV